MNVLASRISRELAGVYGERFALTIPEWRILAHLSERDDCSVGEVRARVAMDKVKVTRAAQRLQAAGLVAKRVSAKDRRLVRLVLTDLGRERMNALIPYARDYEAELLRVLDDEERAAFLAALAKLEAATAGGAHETHDDEGGT